MDTSGTTGGGSNTGSTGGGTTKTKTARFTGSYKEMVDDIYNKHFSQYGYFTVHDAARLILAEYNYEATETDRLRDGIRRYLNKLELYESVDHSIVPTHVIDQFKHTKKQTTWWRRKSSNIDMET